VVEFSGNIQMWFTMGLILVAIIGYANDKIPMELTSIVLIGALLVFFHFFPLRHESGWNILTTEKLLTGFANPALISVLSLLVLGQAIVQTGALNEIANLILQISRNNAFLSIGISLVFVLVVSAFLNNTPVVVIFIPIMAALSKAVNISASKVMIPLSYASILGGMVTLIGSSTNLLVSGILIDMGLPPISFFDFSVPGMMLASVGLLYVLFIVPKLLPDRASLVKSFEGEDDDRQFVAQIEVDYSSDFVGQKMDKGIMAQYPEISVRMIQRGEHAFLPPFDDDIVVRPRDILVISAPKKELASFFAKNPESLGNELEHVKNSIDDDDEVDKKNG
jgi:di/tricarboxylate transporter